MDEYFSDLLVLATHVQDITEERLLQIDIGGLKQSIQSEIQLLDIKDMKQGRQKEKLIEEKQKTQRSSVYIPPHLIKNGKNDDNTCHKCNAIDWHSRHECEN